MLFFEHKRLYPVNGELGGPEEIVPLGKASVVSEGADVTVAAAMTGVHDALRAAEVLAERGIRIEIVDIRSFRPLDIETIAASARKTGRILVIEEGPTTGGWSAQILASVVENALGDLDDAWRLTMPDLDVANTDRRAGKQSASAPSRHDGELGDSIRDGRAQFIDLSQPIYTGMPVWVSEVQTRVWEVHSHAVTASWTDGRESWASHALLLSDHAGSGGRSFMISFEGVSPDYRRADDDGNRRRGSGDRGRDNPRGVRPERIMIGSASRERANTARAVVSDMIFHRNVVRLGLLLTTGERLIAEQARGEKLAETGDTIEVGWEATDTFAFREGEADRPPEDRVKEAST